MRRVDRVRYNKNVWPCFRGEMVAFQLKGEWQEWCTDEHANGEDYILTVGWFDTLSLYIVMYLYTTQYKMK